MNASMVQLKPKILIIEDDRDLREMLLLALRDLEWSTALVEDGIAALQLLLAGLKEGQAYPVVIVDCAMPFIDGFTTVRTIRCLESNHVLPQRTKIGMYTGYEELLKPSTLLQETDIDGFVSKTDPESLIALVKTLIVVN